MQPAGKISATSVLLGELTRAILAAGRLALTIAEHDGSLSDEMTNTIAHLECGLAEVESGMALLLQRLDLNGQEHAV